MLPIPLWGATVCPACRPLSCFRCHGEENTSRYGDTVGKLRHRVGSGCKVERNRENGGLAREKTEAPGGPRGTEPGPSALPPTTTQGSQGATDRKGLSGARVAAEGHEADRTGAYATASWTTVKPAPRQETNSLQAGGRQQALPSGGRDSDQQTEAVGQAPRTPPPIAKPREGARRSLTSKDLASTTNPAMTAWPTTQMVPPHGS